MDTSDEWIRTGTGIEQRRIANDNTNASDMAYGAAKAALDKCRHFSSRDRLILVSYRDT